MLLSSGQSTGKVSKRSEVATNLKDNPYLTSLAVKFYTFTEFVDPKPSSPGSFNQLYPIENITPQTFGMSNMGGSLFLSFFVFFEYLSLQYFVLTCFHIFQIYLA